MNRYYVYKFGYTNNMRECISKYDEHDLVEYVEVSCELSARITEVLFDNLCITNEVKFIDESCEKLFQTSKMELKNYRDALHSYAEISEKFVKTIT